MPFRRLLEKGPYRPPPLAVRSPGAWCSERCHTENQQVSLKNKHFFGNYVSYLWPIAFQNLDFSFSIFVLF